MDLKKLVSNNEICSVPWTHMDINLSTGRVIPCCKYRGSMGTVDNFVKIWSGDEMKKLRQNFLHGEGVKLYECSKCDSDSNVHSLMRVKNQHALALNLLDNIDVDNPTLPTSATISLNNICNLTCRMCSPMFSSKLAELVKKSPIIESMLIYEKLNKFSFDMLGDSMSELRFVSFMGGEPLFNKDFVNIIRNLKQQAKRLKVIVFSTNMTVLNIPVFDELKDISHPVLLVSLDGPKNINNYIRAGSDYDSIVNNIKYVAKNYPNVQWTISCTTSALNVGYLPEYIESIHHLENDTGIKLEKIGNSLVYDPHPLHPASLPDHVKELYRKKLLNFDSTKCTIPSSQSIIDSGLYMLDLPPEGDQTPENFYKFITEYDRILGTDYKTLYPEFI